MSAGSLALSALSEGNQLKLSMRRNDAHGWERCANENQIQREACMGKHVCVAAWGTSFLSRPRLYFLYISISACLSVYSCFFCIFVHFSESPDTKQRISRQTRGRKWGKSRALGPVWLSCRNDRSSQALKAEPRGLNHGLVTNSGKHIWILRTLGGSSFAP